MGGLFGGSKGPSQAELDAQKKQTEIQEKQEDKAKRQEAEEQRRLAGQLRARRTGGMRSLLSPERENAQAGLKTKLGE